MTVRRTRSSASTRIVRTMGLFTGMKGVGLLCSIVRNKLIAAFIGPAGIGIITLYNSVVDLVAQTSRLSIDQTIQRDISQSGTASVGKTLVAARQWAIRLGLAGALIMCALSPLLSLWSFDTTERWPVFCLLSTVTFMLTYGSCVTAENQGLRRFKAVVNANILAAVLGIVIVIPLILWLKIESIIWIVVAYGVTSWLGAYLFRPVLDKNIRLGYKETLRVGRRFIKLGAQITLAMFITQALNYFFILYLNTFASTDELGIYQSGYTMLTSYISLIFSALWIEYYPRLSACAHSPARLSLAASHEASVTLSLLAPLLCLLIIFINPIIKLIYTDAFLPAATYIIFGCVGTLFRLLSWCMAYVVLVRGDGKVYLTTEIVSAITGLALNIAGYSLGGLFGLGIAFILWYLIYTVMMVMVCRYRYKVKYNIRVVITSMVTLAAVTSIAVVCLIYKPFC